MHNIHASGRNICTKKEEETRSWGNLHIETICHL